MAETISGAHYTYPRRDGQAEWAWISSGMVYPPKVVTNPSTNRARSSVSSLMWRTPLLLRQTSLQSCGHGISSTERSVSAIRGSDSSCCWSAWSSSSALILITPAAGSGMSSSYVGRRSFPVAASILWNSLPPDIQSSASPVISVTD